MSTIFQVSDGWKEKFPGAQAGILVMKDVSNPASHPALDEKRVALESSLREHYLRPGSPPLQENPVIAAYTDYYRSFGKTYHVKLQLESVVFKAKPIVTSSALVQAMFMAELENMILTAGHDLEKVKLPIRLDVSKGGERYVLLNGKEQGLKPGDMFMRDREGIISSVLYGPDARTRILAETREVVFAVYAPRGIERERILRHLGEIEENVRLFSPNARVEEVTVVTGAP
jgi:DNA/RNA-binding domain of Phe-tRNA-synthetase-like protein